MSDLVVRAYNVGFGDAVLVSVPDRSPSGVERVRHVLIDVGNLLAGGGNDDRVFLPVVEDIALRTGGVVDLYVMTHEHLDHVQGLLAAHEAGVELQARWSWLTGSAHRDYYRNNPDARKKLDEDRRTLTDVTRQLAAADDEWLEFMVRNNSALLAPGVLGLRTADYVDHLRTLSSPRRTLYVDRETSTEGRHPFEEATLRVLAPERDTSVYYSRRSTNLLRTDEVEPAAGAVQAAATYPSPPTGVDPGAFFDLVASRQRHRRQLVLEIDKAANNTSIVLEIEWRGWRLIFGGDAEERSWEMMLDTGVLRPADLVKISHHGSENGTVEAALDAVLPKVAPDDRPRHAILSTHDGDWPSVPDPGTVDLYASRGVVHDTRTVARGGAVEVRLPG